MIKLKNIEILKFKSFTSPQKIVVENDLTVLVGMNESGKTSVLECLAKTNYFESDEKFLDKGMFSDIIYIYLTNYFMVEMTMRFNNIIKEIVHKKPLPDKHIQKLLMQAWASVTDFFVLQILLNNKTDIDEYIILIGYKHIENIEGHLNNLNSISSSAGKPFVKLTKQIGNPLNHTCTSVYRSYRF